MSVVALPQERRPGIATLNAELAGRHNRVRQIVVLGKQFPEPRIGLSGKRDTDAHRPSERSRPEVNAVVAKLHARQYPHVPAKRLVEHSALPSPFLSARNLPADTGANPLGIITQPILSGNAPGVAA